MSDPTLLYCVGATKAGTSWLYRYLHDHPECKMPAVKEAHYWDTFEPEQREKQLAAFALRLDELRLLRAEAQDNNRGWQVKNVDRRIADMTGLIATLSGDRTGDLGYAEWLLHDLGDKRLVGDMTPNYATLSEEKLQRMVKLSPTTKFIYLIRDPLDRMWSHIRMQAKRFRQDHEIYEKKANNILHRMLNKNQETHILERGDYPAIIKKLHRIVPQTRLLIQFTEDLFTKDGLAKLCRFLGITAIAPNGDERIHAGREVIMRDDLRPRAVALLREHYEWVAQNVGPLPQRWQDNLQRAMA